MKNRVLITSVGRKVSLVNAFKEAGWFVIGQDENKSSVGLSYCDGVGDITTPVDLIIPTRDAEILELINPYSNCYNTIETCLDKFKFHGFCKFKGFRSPEVYFVKPRISKSGKETECVWQELVNGEEYSVDLFCSKPGTVVSVIPRIRLKVLNGESVITETVRNERLLGESQRLAYALGLMGHNCLQCFITKESEIIWTDVNCRFGGASIVSIEAGCKSPEWYLRLVNGEEIKPCIGEYVVGLRGQSYTEWDFGVQES